MASMICRCGERLTDFLAPNEIQLWVYTDFEWDKLLEQDTVNTWEITRPKHSVWRCPKCERVYVFDRGDSDPIKVYCLEEKA